MSWLSEISKTWFKLPDKKAAPHPSLVEPPQIHHTTATSFADPADVRRYKKALADGLTHDEALGKGDNGEGCWGDDTTSTTVPMCALPEKHWRPLGKKARGAKVIVIANGKEIVCELRDTSGTRDVVDLNPAAVAALGLRPPIKIPAKWLWAKKPLT